MRIMPWVTFDAIVRDNFKFREIACPCCGLVVYSCYALDLLQNFRNRVGVPVTVTSGTRCEKHNKEVGGHERSGHLRGLDFDVMVKDRDKDSLVSTALAVGFTRVLFYQETGHLHMGV